MAKPESRDKRPLAITIISLWMGVSVLFLITGFIFHHDKVVEEYQASSYTFFSSKLFFFITIFTIVFGLAVVLGYWRMKKWGVVCYCFMVVTSLFTAPSVSYLSFLVPVLSIVAGVYYIYGVKKPLLLIGVFCAFYAIVFLYDSIVISGFIEHPMRITGTEACAKIENIWEKNSCYTKAAVEKRNISICLREPNLSWREFCLRGYAVGTDNESICEGLTYVNDKGDKSREICFNEVAISNKKAGLCDKAGDTLRDSCLNDIAYASMNASICEFINDHNLSDRCIKYIARYEKDPSLCTYIRSEAEQIECYVVIAVRSENLQLCQSIDDFKVRGGCVAGYASYKKDLSICDTLEDISLHNYCIKEVANKNWTITLCKTIKDDKIRKECYDYFPPSYMSHIKRE